MGFHYHGPIRGRKTVFIAADLQRPRNPGEAEIALCCANLCLGAHDLPTACVNLATLMLLRIIRLIMCLQNKKTLDGYMVADGCIH